MYLPAKLNFWSPPSATPYTELLGRLRQRQAHWQRCRQFDKRAPQLTGLALVAAVLEHLAIRVEFDTADLRHLPPGQAFLAVAN
ncbi:MAG: hypothetical protein ACRYG7_54890 [Janthinobacterium lividum]